MSEITQISPQKKKQDRFNVFIDGKYAFGISANLVFEKKLKTGQKISPSETDELVFSDQTERLLNKALKFLSFRMRSEKEIRDHLLWKGKLKEIETEVEKRQYEMSIENVIRKLKKIKQIDDEGFAEWWVGQRKDFSPRASSIVKKELISKGIERDIIEKFLEKDTEEELRLAIELAKKKMKNLSKYENKEKRKKVSQFLARRGFDWEVTKKAVDTLILKE